MAELLIAVLELLEAEGIALRRGVGRLVAGLGFLLCGLTLGLGGLGLLVWSLYLRLVLVISPTAAGFLSGFAALLVAGGLLWFARNLIR